MGRKRDISQGVGWLVAGVLAAVSLVTGLMSFQQTGAGNTAKFSLSEVADNQGEIREITADELAGMIGEKKSFIVLARMTVCPAEFPLTSVAKQFAHERKVPVYALTEEEFKRSSLAETIKYLPSAAIYREGELVTYLDAEKDEDVPYYQSAEKFGEWVGKVVKL